MAGALKDHDARQPIGPGDAAWLRMRAMHAKLLRMSEERDLADWEIDYDRLRR
jgi:hypothetical protein